MFIATVKRNVDVIIITGKKEKKETKDYNEHAACSPRPGLAHQVCQIPWQGVT